MILTATASAMTRTAGANHLKGVASMTTSIPTEQTHPNLTEDEVNFLRLKWRAARESEGITVEKCDHFDPPIPHDRGDDRYHVYVDGHTTTGHFNYDACWYIIVGAQMRQRANV